ncbi:MAG: DUF547 domain-containing protein [Cellulophaga sp.]
MKLSKGKSILVLFLLTAFFGYSQSTSEFFTKADAFFKEYVKDGKVKYSQLKKNTAALDELVQLAEGVSVSKDNIKEYQAFWINGYNISVIKTVVANYPMKSPLDKSGFFDEIKHTIGGENISLNGIENTLLRANFPKEARFHFVLVCAGLGCPPIIGTAYLPSSLEVQLEEQTKIALNNPNFIKVTKKRVKISQIFEWYTKDFTQGGLSLVDYINKYRKEKLAEKSKMSFYPYDWTLNQIK